LKKILYADGSDNNIYLYCKLNIFIKLNPPCKECLIQSMCIKDISVLLDEYAGVQIKSCDLLREFINKEQKKFNHI